MQRPEGCSWHLLCGRIFYEADGHPRSASLSSHLRSMPFRARQVSSYLYAFRHCVHAHGSTRFIRSSTSRIVSS